MKKYLIEIRNVQTEEFRTVSFGLECKAIAFKNKLNRKNQNIKAFFLGVKTLPI